MSASQEPMPRHPTEPGAGSPSLPADGPEMPGSDGPGYNAGYRPAGDATYALDGTAAFGPGGDAAFTSGGGEAPYGPPPYAFGPWEPRRPPRRPWRRTLKVAVLTGLAVAVAGVVLGVIWHFVSPTVPVIDAGASGIVVNDPSPEEYIASDGWFTLLGFAFGLVAAVTAWMVRRRDRGPALLLGVTLGALAAAPVAWQVGRQIGLGAYGSWRDTAASGATYQAPPDLHTHGALLVPAFAAVIVTTLLAGWSNDPDLDQPGAKPGYGRDLQPGHPVEGSRASAADPTAGLPAGWQQTAGPAVDLPAGWQQTAGPAADLPGRPDNS